MYGYHRTRVHATMALRRGGACQADAGPAPPFGGFHAVRYRAMMLP